MFIHIILNKYKMNEDTIEDNVTQAPVPYLNRAIAEEQLGVEAAASGRDDEAALHYNHAIQAKHPWPIKL